MLDGVLSTRNLIRTMVDAMEDGENQSRDWKGMKSLHFKGSKMIHVGLRTFIPNLH